MADWAEAADGSAGADGAPALASVEVFEGLDAAAVAALAAACRWLELPEGAVVATDLLGPGTVYFILAGRLTVTAAGKDGLPPDPPLCLGPQQTFGELHAMDSRGEPERAVAVGAVRLAACPRDLFRAFVQAQPALAQRLLTRFAHRLRGGRPSAEAPSAAQRVYRELARLARPHPSGDGSWVISPMPLHRDIAAATGTAPEDVAQAIGHLMRSGAIRRRNLDIILLDRRGVQELAAQR